MIVLGLTGSIGMGKSTAASILRRMGVPVHESDSAVHELLRSHGEAKSRILAAFPEAAGPSGSIDRAALGRAAFGSVERRKVLEAILHPLVRARQEAFIRRCRRKGARLAVLDIPLLYETGADARVDGVIVVTAPAFVQRSRLRARGMTAEDAAARVAAQMPDPEKRRRADYVVQTGHGMLYTRRRLQAIVKNLAKGKNPS